MKYFEIGKIVNTQGIKGDVRVVATTFDKSRFELLNEVYVFIRDKVNILSIEKIWYHKNFVIIKFQGIDDMNAAERLKNGIIKIDEQLALPLGEDEYYIGDLYDMEVFTDTGEFLGLINDIIETGANDVYSVKSDNGDKILIPAIKQCILKVDIINKVMTVRLLEGLR